jgi:hypothetical protein
MAGFVADNRAMASRSVTLWMIIITQRRKKNMMIKSNAAMPIYKSQAETASASGCHHYAPSQHDAGLATGAKNGQQE